MVVNPNERDTTQDKSILNNFVSLIKSLTSPILDKFKPTKRPC